MFTKFHEYGIILCYQINGGMSMKKRKILPPRSKRSNPNIKGAGSKDINLLGAGGSGGIETKRKGDIGEIRACLWFLEKGYEVFRNIGGTGPIDIIVVKQSEVRYLDVKTTPTHKKREYVDWDHIEYFYVNRKTGNCSFDHKEVFKKGGGHYYHDYMKDPIIRKKKRKRDSQWKSENREYMKQYNKKYYNNNKKQIMNQREISTKLSSFF
jgi:Holliday junction resolvase-like predicted endonuclease